jgi:uncharacterized membrane protein
VNRLHRLRRAFLTGLLVLVPAWGTFLVLRALFTTLDGVIADILGPAVRPDIPGLGILMLLVLVPLVGMLATRFLGQRLFRWTDRWVQRIPIAGSVYLTLKGMADLFQFRERFGRSTVVVFPFPRDGLWALGFAMGPAPPALQLPGLGPLVMVFVPTAIHPFTGYLAFLPHGKVFPVNLPAEEAMKMEFSAGLYRSQPGWLRRLSGPEAETPVRRQGESHDHA